jgi:flavodoxin
MNALVVYYSKFGNTKRVAEAIAETWQSAGSIRVMSADQLTALDINNVDLLVVGTPTHVANLPKELRPILEALPKRVLKGVRVAAFDTSYKMNWFVSLFTAAKPLSRNLRRLGGKQIVPPRSFFVVEKQGPLYEGEIERAKTWAETILARHRRFSEHQQAKRQ